MQGMDPSCRQGMLLPEVGIVERKDPVAANVEPRRKRK